ncbi:peptidoglycan recognition protein family protein [Listeria grandensis]|uniref:peptidoglycan recognition protein family protein n=1 Tax=Listeria grandensis TaxID=1494963 RepID=UPI00164DE549|nr:peptidoglycan recognition family protein [Listeria grandensis]MBC6316390.1 N-acetylmuramoyl-L-alanine amidase [Listeria grandensis]
MSTISPLATPYEFESFVNPGEERWNSREGAEITTVVVHHMAKTDFDEVPEVWREREASAHYGIGPSGEIRVYVGEEHRAWHARAANSYSIGIECCNVTEAPDWEVSEKTIDSLVLLIQDINARYDRKMRIVGHQCAEGNSAETTQCPGPSLIPRLAEIVRRVNEYDEEIIKG